jgi:hypothetical protein
MMNRIMIIILIFAMAMTIMSVPVVTAAAVVASNVPTSEQLAWVAASPFPHPRHLIY